MKYLLVRLEEHLTMIDEKQAKDIRNELVDLTSLTELLGGEVRFDSFTLNTTHIEPRKIILIEFRLTKSRHHRLAIFNKYKRGIKNPIYMGVLLDYEDKDMDGMHYENFFETIPELYIQIQDLIKSKLYDLDILINEALDRNEKEWFEDLAKKKNFLQSKII